MMDEDKVDGLIRLFAKRLLDQKITESGTILFCLNTSDELLFPLSDIFQSDAHGAILDKISEWHEYYITRRQNDRPISSDIKDILKGMERFRKELLLFKSVLSKNKVHICDAMPGGDDDKISFTTLLEKIETYRKESRQAALDALNKESDQLLLEQLEMTNLLPEFHLVNSADEILAWAINQREGLGAPQIDLKWICKSLLRLKGISFDADSIDQQVDALIFEHELMTGENLNSQPNSVSDIDALSGIEFEKLVGSYFETSGYTVEYTPASGDQGADLIIQNESGKTVIQLKRYSGTVGNGAVQEVVAAMSFYDADFCMVITSSYFTESAISLAEANDVTLLDRDWVVANLC